MSTATLLFHNNSSSIDDLFAPSVQDWLFRGILAILFVIYMMVAVVVPMLETPEVPREVKEQLPPQLAKIILEERPLPEPKKPEPEPLPEPEPEPEAKPAEEAQAGPLDAKEQAENAGLAAMKDELFAMRDAFKVQPPAASQLANSEAAETKVERKMLGAQTDLTSEALAKSTVTQTVATSEVSRKSTQQIRLAEEEIVAAQGAQAERNGNANGSGPGQRSELALRQTLEANKSRLYSLYNRALRKDPFLQGKVLFKIEILPNGTISNVSIQSSELNNAKLERQLTVVLQSIRFPAEAAATMTTIWAIDFLPS